MLFLTAFGHIFVGISCCFGDFLMDCFYGTASLWSSLVPQRQRWDYRVPQRWLTSLPEDPVLFLPLCWRYWNSFSETSFFFFSPFWLILLNMSSSLILLLLGWVYWLPGLLLLLPPQLIWLKKNYLLRTSWLSQEPPWLVPMFPALWLFSIPCTPPGVLLQSSLLLSQQVENKKPKKITFI